MESQHFPTKEKLHTDILEQKYGPIHAEVLRHDDKNECAGSAECLREARLVDKDNILRTYALTFLNFDVINTEILKIDNEIRSGGLIGKTFRNHGYVIKKNVISVFLLDMPKWMGDDFKVGDDKAKARLTEFYAKKDSFEPVIYGTVLEVYSPDFRSPDDGINDVDLAQVNPTINDMKKVGISSREIWSRLDKSAEIGEWDDMKDKYVKAQKLSAPAIESLKSRIYNYINSK